MDKKRLRLWAGAGVLALACAAGFAASGGDRGRPADTGHRFLHVGDFYLKASKIDYAVRRGGRLVVVFGSEAGTRLELSGPDAETMCRWLENERVDSDGPHQGGQPKVDHSHGASRNGPQNTTVPQHKGGAFSNRP